TAGNRLAMREFGLSAAQFGQLTFASLFPTLTQTAVSVPLPLTPPPGPPQPADLAAQRIMRRSAAGAGDPLAADSAGCTGAGFPC
ncbi:hypothetical protein HI908_16900, partial [Klebsiella pneumoniae]|nr:hypothetical protein [Klebsiella pneumoniae]